MEDEIFLDIESGSNPKVSFSISAKMGVELTKRVELTVEIKEKEEKKIQMHQRERKMPIFIGYGITEIQ